MGNQVQAALVAVGATATYNLGPGANNLGYDITSIQSIAAWVNVGFGNQAYTVDVKLIGETSYTTLATVDCELRRYDGGATKVTLTDDGGVLASGVEFIRFTLNQVNAGDNGGGFMAREFDVFGVSTGGDSTAPTIVTRNPPNNASGVAGITALVATFDENILRGTGNITIKNLDTSALTEIPVGDPQVSVAGAVLVREMGERQAPHRWRQRRPDRRPGRGRGAELHGVRLQRQSEERRRQWHDPCIDREYECASDV